MLRFNFSIHINSLFDINSLCWCNQPKPLHLGSYKLETKSRKLLTLLIMLCLQQCYVHYLDNQESRHKRLSSQTLNVNLVIKKPRLCYSSFENNLAELPEIWLGSSFFVHPMLNIEVSPVFWNIFCSSVVVCTSMSPQLWTFACSQVK